MQFGGIQKTSLIDYPDKVSCVLFVLGCNFRCPYCHNPGLVKRAPGFAIDENEIWALLHERKNFLDGVVISGGEPCICKEIFYICKKIKDIGYKIKLDTNGSRPNIIEMLIKEKMIDYIAMDIKTLPENYAPFITGNIEPDKIISSIKTIMGSNIDYEFRTTCARPFIDDIIMDKITDIIRDARLYALQQVNLRDVMDPDFFKDFDAAFDEMQMENLKSIADSKVKKCIIR